MDKARTTSTSIQRIITRDQLATVADLQELKEELLCSIKSLLAQHNNYKRKKWLKSYEVRKLLAISHGTLQTLRNNGTIPFSKIGGTIFYDEDRIAEMINERNGKYRH